MSLKLTEKAAAEVKKYLAAEGLPDSVALRVGITAGGCSGFNYELNFDSDIDEAVDKVTELQGVRVVVDKKSSLYLDGTEIDYHESLEKRGFTFNNPNAVKSCGCGSSFQA